MTAATAVAEELVLRVGQHELHLRGADALDLLDRLVELTLERALVGDLLLEVRGAELLLVEQLKAGLRLLPEQARRGQRDRAPAPSGRLSTAIAVPLFWIW